MKRRLAIIPARGGSKRIPNKNIKSFVGKPMIEYIIDSAFSSKLFDEIHVSTDSIEIKEIATKEGKASVDFFRPDYLSDEFTPLMPVLKYVVEKLEVEFGLVYDEIWLLMACSPLISKNDLLNAADFYIQNGTNKSMIAICELPVPVEWAMKVNKKNELLPLVEGGFAKRSQDLDKSYFDCGIFSVYKPNFIKNSIGPGTLTDYIGYKFPKYKTVDIDTIEDWEHAENLYKIINHTYKLD